MVVGDFEGGELHCSERGSLSLRDRVVFFIPCFPHKVLAHSGDRMSLVAYLHPEIKKASDDTKRGLRDLGFMMTDVDRPGVVPPTRVQVSKELASCSDVVYVGRGHAGFGLAKSDD